MISLNQKFFESYGDVLQFQCTEFKISYGCTELEFNYDLLSKSLMLETINSLS